MKHLSALLFAFNVMHLHSVHDNELTMGQIASNPRMRALAVVLVLFHVLLPGTAAVAQANGIDVAHVLCLTPGSEPSEAAKRHAQMLAELMGEEAPTDPQSEKDCPLCVVAKAKVLTPIFEIAVPAPASAETRFWRCAPCFVHYRSGPRLGGRAPPLSI